MQAASNFVQDSVLGGPVETVVTPSYKHREGGETMQALTWQASDKVQVKQMPIPDITQDEDVVLKVTMTTVCGSDLHLLHGEILALQKDDILGHEFGGIVDRVGPRVKNLKVGDRVVTSFQIACGECRFCKDKLSSLCDNTNNSSLMPTMYGGQKGDAGFFGYSHFTGGFPGGQAEYVKVPKGDVNCQKIPDELADENVLWLSDVYPTSYHAVYGTKVGKGDIVGVWGAGPIGQCTIRWALLKGASKVIVVDSVPSRLKLAKEAPGDIQVINFKETPNVVEEVYKLVPGGLDIAIDCGTFHEPKTMLHKVEKALMLETDVPETINECIESVHKAGAIGTIAAYAAYANHVNVGAIMEKGVTWYGLGQAPVHLHRDVIMEHLLKGEFDAKFMVSHRVDISEFAELYEAFDKRWAGVNKVFVQTKFSKPPSPGYPQLSSVKGWPREQL